MILIAMTLWSNDASMQAHKFDASPGPNTPPLISPRITTITPQSPQSLATLRSYMCA